MELGKRLLDTADFGLGIWSKVMRVVTLVSCIVFFNVFQGVREVSRNILASVCMLGASRRQLLRTVYLPSATSWVFSSRHTSVGMAFVGAVIGRVSRLGLVMMPSSPVTRHTTAIDKQRLARHICGAIGGEEYDRGSHLVRKAVSRKWNARRSFPHCSVLVRESGAEDRTSKSRGDRRSWAYRVDGNSRGRHVQSKTLCKADHRCFRGTIGGTVSQRMPCDSGRNIDDASPALAPHRADRSARHQEDAAYIDRHRVLPSLQGHFLDIRAVGALRGRGVVHQNIEPAMASERVLHQPRGIRLAAHISANPACRTACGLDLLDKGRQSVPSLCGSRAVRVFSVCRRDIRNHDRHPRCCQCASGRGTDTIRLATTGNQRNAPRLIQCGSTECSWWPERRSFVSPDRSSGDSAGRVLSNEV